MSSGELLSWMGTDAARWAEAFAMHAKIVDDPSDQGWLIGWFANAVMAGHDEEAAHSRSLADELRHIAQHCTHAPDGAGHIYEPTTGGYLLCGPCRAWRVLNGSPGDYDLDTLDKDTRRGGPDGIGGDRPWR